MSRTLGMSMTVAIAVMILPWTTGCSMSDAPASAITSSTTEAKVSGTVKVLGKIMTEGEVRFDPSNVNRKDAAPRSAKIDKNGHYEITTLVGNNTVSVRGKAITSNPKLGYVMKTFDVQSGENTFDIEAP